MYQSGFQELLGEFLLEARERSDEVEALLLRLASADPEASTAALAQAKRELHTLKGNSGMMGFSNLQQLAHRMEDRVEELDLAAPDLANLLSDLDELRRGLDTIGHTITDAVAAEEEVVDAPEMQLPVEESFSQPWDAGGSVRVPFSKIDHLVELQAETLIFRNRLLDAIHQGQTLLQPNAVEEDDLLLRLTSAWEDVDIAQQALGKTLNLLQEQVMNLSLVPLQGLFRSLRRVVHDESTREGKKVELEIQGGDTPIDKALLEAAGEALGHLVRNAVNHGIESPRDRLHSGKGEVGTIRLSANLEGNQVWIEVADDGAGIDLARLRDRAKPGSATAQDEDEYAFLFEEGVSIRESADLGAGRGVGLSAVKKTVERQSGRIEIKSEPGRGTSFSLRLPVTASILRSLIVRSDGEDYALPLTAVTETLRADSSAVHAMNHAQVVRWRGRVVSILDLGQTFGTTDSMRREGFLVIIEVNGRYRALAIDEIAGIHDIVVKGLDRIVGAPAGISGSTILGDGRVIMILDPAALANLSPSTSAHTDE